MLITHLLVLVFGLVALVTGAELLVKKAALLADKLHIHPFFIGVILLGMGTSAPEWAVSTISSIRDLSDLAVANVLGSNIFNILLVLGLILFKPLSKTNIQLIKKDILFLLLSGFSLIPLMLDSFLSRWDALCLTLIFLIYIVISLFSAKKNRTIPPGVETKSPILLKEIFFIILGFGLLIGGSHFTVMGAADLSKQLGMSERLIGILIVSVGTGLPELLASLTAIIKGHKDMAVGNIIGSNIFNTFAILGTASWIRPASIDTQMLTIDLPVLLTTHMALLLLLFCHRIKWIQKIIPYIFFSGYFCYLTYLLIA